MNERTIFLFDSVGALLSFVFTGLILPSFSDALGLSRNVIYFLAAFPAVYMIYSFTCYRWIKEIKGWMLLTIISANLLYSLVSGSLIVFHDGLRDPGQYLLTAEIVVVLAVIGLELKVYQKFLRR